MGFKAKISIETKTKAKAKVEVNKFLTASRNINSNIEGLDINNLAAGLITLIGLIILTYLIFIKKVVIKVIKILLSRKAVVTAIGFSYFFINF